MVKNSDIMIGYCVRGSELDSDCSKMDWMVFARVVQSLWIYKLTFVELK